MYIIYMYSIYMENKRLFMAPIDAARFFVWKFFTYSNFTSVTNIQYQIIIFFFLGWKISLRSGRIRSRCGHTVSGFFSILILYRLIIFSDALKLSSCVEKGKKIYINFLWVVGIWRKGRRRKNKFEARKNKNTFDCSVKAYIYMGNSTSPLEI